jgi:hypothetical protein
LSPALKKSKIKICDSHTFAQRKLGNRENATKIWIIC